MPYGFDDDAAIRQLLRSPPSDAAIAWVAEATGDEVVRWDVLRGGTSSAMYSLELADGRQLVLRCRVRDEDEPDPAAGEAAALGVAVSAVVPTPLLIAVDRDGRRAGIPSVLSSPRLPPGQRAVASRTCDRCRRLGVRAHRAAVEGHLALSRQPARLRSRPCRRVHDLGGGGDGSRVPPVGGYRVLDREPRRTPTDSTEASGSRRDRRCNRDSRR